DGSIVIKKVTGDVTIDDGSGAIKVIDVDGEVHIENEQGRVVQRKAGE
ncbi:MAG: hypothetical protein HN348_22730, partial [Proteobacteria bacterium]|nr:hypothetical protein [Pseudomonadota bacterium]